MSKSEDKRLAAQHEKPTLADEIQARQRQYTSCDGTGERYYPQLKRRGDCVKCRWVRRALTEREK